MKENTPTLAIYGIQDNTNLEHANISHDHNLAYFHKGRLIHYLHLERLTRKKYDKSLPENILSLLRRKNLLHGKYDLVFADNILGRSFISKEGNIRFEAPLNNQILNTFETGRCWFLDAERSAYVVNHELAHIFSCVPFFGKFKENSLLIHFDGGASLSNFSAWRFKNNRLELLESGWELDKYTSFFNSNALVFSILGANAKFQHSVPGKFMGFSSYGEYKISIEHWLDRFDYFKDIWGSKKEFFERIKTEFGIQLKSFDQRNKLIQDIAATIHHIFEKEFIKKVVELQKKYRSEQLYYSGGSALSIKANSELVKLKLFKNIFIPPCCNDSGLSLGAGAFLEMQKNNALQIISPFINNWDIEDVKISYTEKIIFDIASDIAAGKIIAVCNGYGESGPRALGNRSIIVRADNKELSKKISMKIKGREWYRPVAPLILLKNFEYFTSDAYNHLAKLMLLDFSVNQNHKKEIQGAMHVDGTSRFQVIEKKEDNEFMFDLLTKLDAEYRIKAVINTSFNENGQPIVHTNMEAMETAKKMGLDGLVVQGEYFKFKV